MPMASFWSRVTDNNGKKTIGHIVYHGANDYDLVFLNGDTYETLDYSDLSDLLGEDVEYEIESSDDDYISILVDESVGEEAYDVYNENNPAKAVKYYTDINSEHKSTREWAEFARENGYDGVIFRKLRDIGRYDKKYIYGAIQDAIRENRILYADKKRSHLFVRGERLQLPNSLYEQDFTDNIEHFGKMSNMKWRKNPAK